MKIYVKGFVPFPAGNYLGYITEDKIRIPFTKEFGGDVFLQFELPPATSGREMLIVVKGGAGYIEVD